jgi:hypothetical protein
MVRLGVREERSRQAVAAAVGLARELGLRVEEPVVLADLFSLMVRLRPAPVVARVATCMSRPRSPIEDWLRLEIDVTTFLAAQGAPVVAPSRELPPGPHSVGGSGSAVGPMRRPILIVRCPLATARACWRNCTGSCGPIRVRCL